MFKKTGGPRHARKVSSPTADFALSFDMITKDEHAAAMKGDMEVTNTTITNLNARHPTLKTGESEKLYQGRATKILIDMLLGITHS